MHYLQLGVGHYGVFNGSRFRSEVAPRISDFILSIETPAKTAGAPARRPPLKVAASLRSSSVSRARPGRLDGDAPLNRIPGTRPGMTARCR